MSRSKFSKSSQDVIFRVEEYLKTNVSSLIERVKLNDIYKKQNPRNLCKVCYVNFMDAPWFECFGIKYYLCLNCDHLNGEFEDSPEFTNTLYSDSNTSTYSLNYNSEFDLRVSKIYIPKIDFLLEKIDVPVEEIRMLDFGCGAGNLVKAAQIRGIKCIGLETNYDLVEIGKKQVGGNSIFHSENLDSLSAAIKNFKPNVVSLIGVLEHLSNMDEVLGLLSEKKIRHVYTSVPVFSLASIMQTLNEEVFPRQLSGGHNHLFSAKSLEKLMGRHGFEVISDWWFGTDISDLRRMLSVTLENRSHDIDKILNSVLDKAVDSMQSSLDRHKITSEVHSLSRNSKL